MMLALDVQARDLKESPEALRARGAIPAVYYGPKEQATPIAVDGRKLAALWKEAGETTIVKLTGVGDEKDTLIHDVQLHPVSGALLHADFYVLEQGKKIAINVPLSFEGQAPAEKAGHIVVKALHEIEIEVAPAELPHSLPVDISVLANVGDHITAGEVRLPPSATLITDAEEIVVSITEFKEEKEETPSEVVPAEIIGEQEGGEEVSASEGDAGEKKAE